MKRPDLFGFRNPGMMIPKLEAIRGGVSDCRNRNLQKMFQLIGLGKQVGSGFPKIYRNGQLQHWREPMIEEDRFRFDLFRLLVWEGIRKVLRQIIKIPALRAPVYTNFSGSFRNDRSADPETRS